MDNIINYPDVFGGNVNSNINPIRTSSPIYGGVRGIELSISG